MNAKFKRLPDSELELMLIIWRAKVEVTRSDIEGLLNKNKKLAPTTILSFLSRLEEKGYIKVERRGKTNYYSPITSEEDYINNEGKTILEKLYGNSLKNFVASLYDGNSISEKQMEELREFLDSSKDKK